VDRERARAVGGGRIGVEGESESEEGGDGSGSEGSHGGTERARWVGAG
jgi:hypothetical protein